MTPLAERERLVLPGGDHASVVKVQQRNWSRVALAVLDGESSPRYFLKQFLAADGTAQPNGLISERQSSHIGRDVIGECVMVPEFEIESRAVLAYPYRQMLTTDELLRRRPDTLDLVWSRFCTDLAETIDKCVAAAATDGGAPASSTALGFKALEVRNIAPAVDGLQALCIFDLGPSFESTSDDVAARLMVSVLLLNWGRPLSRFVLGPPTKLAEGAAAAWAGHLRRETVLAALSKEITMRSGSVQGSRSSVRWLKTLGLSSLGRAYERRARRWTEMAFA